MGASSMTHRHRPLQDATVWVLATILISAAGWPSVVAQTSSHQSAAQPPAPDPAAEPSDTDGPDESSSPDDSNLTAEAAATVADAAIADLSNDRFRRRHQAFLTLVRGGKDSIPALEQGAKSGELETRTRCVEALVEIARDKKAQPDVIQAMERLASDPAYNLAGLTERYIKLLKMTDEERAVEALTAAGVRLHRTNDGNVFSVTVTRNRELAWLRHLPSLRSLNISGNGVTNAGLDHLAKMESLTSISISQSGITDAGLAKLEPLTSLTSLSLSGHEFSGSGLRELRKLPKLVSLSLHSGTDDSDLQGLTEIRQLQMLSVTDLKISEQSVHLLNQLDFLRQCTLSIADVDDDVLQAIAKVKAPMLLNLRGSKAIPDESWKHLQGSAITGLIVSGISVTDQGLAHIAKIEQLERLQLFATSMSITETGLEHLHQLKSLQILYLRGVKVSDESIASLKKALPKLQATWIRE